jgi:hypothetical protein
VLKQGHAVLAEVPQKRGVVQPPLPSDRLCIAAELAVPEYVICATATNAVSAAASSRAAACARLLEQSSGTETHAYHHIYLIACCSKLSNASTLLKAE